jgi:hypothetical protein
MLVILILLVVAADLVGPGGQFRERDGADRHLVGQVGGIDPRRKIKMLVSSRPCR